MHKCTGGQKGPVPRKGAKAEETYEKMEYYKIIGMCQLDTVLRGHLVFTSNFPGYRMVQDSGVLQDTD